MRGREEITYETLMTGHVSPVSVGVEDGILFPISQASVLAFCVSHCFSVCLFAQNNVFFLVDRMFVVVT